MTNNKTASETSPLFKKNYASYIQVRDIHELKKDTLQVSLAFETDCIGTLVIKGFRISLSPKHEGYWVQVPSILVYKHFCKLFFVENTDVWEIIKEILICKYREVYPNNDPAIQQLNEQF